MFGAAALLVLASFVRAELGANDVEVIKENVNNAKLEGLFTDFNPEGLIVAHWQQSNTSISIGQPIEPDTAKNFPSSISIQPAPGANFSADALYTALLVDAAQVGTNFTGDTQTLHWLINGIHINTTQQGGPYPLNYDNGTTVIEYAGPNPPAGDAPHRYVFLVFAQPDNFTAPEAYSRAQQYPNPQKFDAPKYFADAKLEKIAGVNFFTVGQPNPTQTVEPTQNATGTITAATDGSSSGGSNGNGNGTGPNGTNPDGTANSNGTANPSDPAQTTPGSGAFKVLPAAGFTAVVAAALAALI